MLKNSAGNFVEPNFDSFSDAAATADFDPKKDFFLWLNNAPGKNSWPIAGATFILLAKEKKDSNMKTVKFFDWAFKNGDAKAKELIYIPLPDSLKAKVREYWKANGIY
jgi:phosphate transport system substrate-binding protein